MVGFWLGLSLVFVLFVWAQQLNILQNQHFHDEISHRPISLGVRLLLTLFGSIGALGTAGLIGQRSTSFPEAAGVCLFGAVCGAWLIMRLKVKRNTGSTERSGTD